MRKNSYGSILRDESKELHLSFCPYIKVQLMSAVCLQSTFLVQLHFNKLKKCFFFFLLFEKKKKKSVKEMFVYLLMLLLNVVLSNKFIFNRSPIRPLIKSLCIIIYMIFFSKTHYFIHV